MQIWQNIGKTKVFRGSFQITSSFWALRGRIKEDRRNCPVTANFGNPFTYLPQTLLFTPISISRPSQTPSPYSSLFFWLPGINAGKRWTLRLFLSVFHLLLHLFPIPSENTPIPLPQLLSSCFSSTWTPPWKNGQQSRPFSPLPRTPIVLPSLFSPLHSVSFSPPPPPPPLTLQWDEWKMVVVES